MFSEIGGIGEIDVNNVAMIEQCNIKVIGYYEDLLPTMDRTIISNIQ